MKTGADENRGTAILKSLETEATDVLFVDFGGVISRCVSTRRCRQVERQYSMAEGLVEWLFANPVSIEALTHPTPYDEILRQLSRYRCVNLEVMSQIIRVYTESNAINTALVKSLQRRRAVSKLYILSNYWTNGRAFISGKLDVGLFDGIFISAEIGFKKSDPRLWEYLSKVLMKSTSSMTLIDDEPENIESASKAGLKTHLWI